MGLFGRFFAKKKTSSLEDSESNGLRNDAAISLPERIWEYEGGAVKNGVHVLGDRYFQDQIKAHNTHTIDARLVDWKGVKCCTVEWYSKDDLSQIYVVDSKGTMLGYIYDKHLPKIGYRLGDNIQVAVTEKYTNNSLSLFILQNEKGITYNERQKAIRYHKIFQQYLSREIEDDDHLIHFNFEDSDIDENLFAKSISRFLNTSWIPTPCGSKAKPHIAVNMDTVMIAEISARNSRYKELMPYVGKKPKQSALVKRKSEYKRNSYYWSVILVY